MEEKNTIKIGLLILFLILLVIIIIVMWIFIYYFYNKQLISNTLSSNSTIEDSNKNNESSTNLNTLNSNIAIEDSNKNNISSTNSNILNSNTAIENSNKSNVSSTNTIISSVDEVYGIDKIARDLFEEGSLKIRETHYSDYYEYKVAEPIVDKEINGNMYRKTNVLYSEIENKYAEIFTGDALKEILNIRFAEIDRYLYIMWGGASGWGITNVKVSKISEENNEINYLVKYNNIEVDDSILEEQSCNMTIKLVDGSYRISATDYCGLQKDYYNK